MSKNAVLPIYHLALLRGTLLQTKADTEALNSLDALYHMAVKNRAEAAGDHIPDAGKLVLADTNVGQVPEDHIVENTEMAIEPRVQAEKPAGTSLDTYRNVDPINVELNMEEAKKKFPHFSEIIDSEFSPALECEEPGQPFTKALLPAEIKPSKAWPAESILFIFHEREKQPPTLWTEIARKLGKEDSPCSMKYASLKKAGHIDLIRAYLGAASLPPAMRKEVEEMPFIQLEPTSQLPKMINAIDESKEPLIEASKETDFEVFWERYPRQRRGNRDKTRKAWDRALQRAQAHEILQGLNRYIQSTDVARGYAKGAEAWLNDDRWAWTYQIEASAASAYAKEYAGYRDDRTLTDEDWKDIRYRYHTLKHANKWIAEDYKVTESEMSIFIRIHDSKEVELAEQPIAGKSPGQLL